MLFRNVSSRFLSIAHEKELAAFGGAACGRFSGGASIGASRAALEKAVGRHGVADAGGVAAMFAAISRVVDLTGHKSTTVKIAAGASSVLLTLRRNAPLIAAAAVAVAVFFWMRRP